MKLKTPEPRKKQQRNKISIFSKCHGALKLTKSSPWMNLETLLRWPSLALQLELR